MNRLNISSVEQNMEDSSANVEALRKGNPGNVAQAQHLDSSESDGLKTNVKHKDEQDQMSARQGFYSSELSASAGIREDTGEGQQNASDFETTSQPAEEDVLSGRGAKVNGRIGNRKFRALCFSRKSEYDAGSLPEKRRIATEIVAATKQTGGKFLRREVDNGPWIEMTNEQAIQKASQVMRDYKRPDRVALREGQSQNHGRKRRRIQESTPMDSSMVSTLRLDPTVENPFGIHDHDVLCGRGAFCNGFTGNERLRDLAMERKDAFDAGNFTEKQALASEIINIIRSLDPPGRFLKRRDTSKGKELPRGLSGDWEELSDGKAIHKATQIMRDINRPDRLERETKRRKKKNLDGSTSMDSSPLVKPAAQRRLTHGTPDGTSKDTLDNVAMPAVEHDNDEMELYEGQVEAPTDQNSSPADIAVAATEDVLDRALESTLL